ncbi:UDP-glucose/GDP-mannose dehydrogenase family protein [candidate division WS5 bacterium]|uniref:UDP-glucose 6-dehydrogenase n=1 Tax=candidate division WS5 bacterium TaxID=2093353 RepID=A0A419DAR2_9BACT|nr:MAG: UDP-glucose/GDP-mannose dehydrogenase family protein [candidate division WS5 bacterium]
MKISIFGLGYVGAVSAGCFANEGHTVIGVDTVQSKVDLVNKGQSPVIEKDIGELILKSIQNGNLIATTNSEEAIHNTQISIICVGTPSKVNGDLNLEYVQRVCDTIGATLRNKSEFHVVVIRSTILPDTMHNVVIPTIEKLSGKSAGKDFGVCNNPEFLREGSAVYDFYHPPKTVIGATDKKSCDILSSLYKTFGAPIIRTDIKTAEIIKYVDNVWHALKVGFANEIGRFCKTINIDSHQVMNIFCQDTKLNLSSYYMKPGFAFGGSCLPKDLRAFTYKGQSLDIELPILNSILYSNHLQVKRAFQMITDIGSKKVGILGFSFKAGTDDLRESPVVELIEKLIGKGYDIRIYDRNVNLARLVGANREYLLNHIPHIEKLMVNRIEDALSYGETIVIGNSSPEFQNIFNYIKDYQNVVDLVRIHDDAFLNKENYNGICW